MSIGNISGSLAAYQYANKTQRNNTAKTGSTGFLSAVSAKQAEKTESADLKDMLKEKYPNSYYNVMDTSKIDGGAWGRQDYPWDAYFKEPADESVLSWKPSGPEPDMQSPQVHAKLNSMLGKVAIVIPPELEEKMKNDPKLAQSVMDKIDNFILENELSAPGVLKGYVMTFDENGKMNHACVAGEGRITVSSSEFVEARKKREAKQAEYERLAEEAAMKRRLRQREVEKNSVGEVDASDADERLLGIGFLKGSGNMHYGMRAEYAEDYSEDNPIIAVRVQKGKGHIVYMKTDDMLYSGGNGTGLSFYLKYAEDSTEDDPAVVAKGVDENGNKFEQTIHINKINPTCATYVEMRALEAYTGVEKKNGFSSLPLSDGNMGLNDRRNFMDMFEKTIRDLTTLNSQKAASYYRYSMQAYWDFMSSK